MAKSNKSILEHILSYCNEIQTTMLRFGDNLDTFINDIDYRKSVSLSILQIGELAGKLSDEYRQSTTEMPWRQIRGLRNIVAHSMMSYLPHGETVKKQTTKAQRN